MGLFAAARGILAQAMAFLRSIRFTALPRWCQSRLSAVIWASPGKAAAPMGGKPTSIR